MIRTSLAISAFFLLGASSCAGTELHQEDMKSVAAEIEAQAQDVDSADTNHSVDHQSDDNHHLDGPRPYDETRDGWVDLNTTRAAAQQSGKRAMIVMGANWCHDSRGLASYFEDPEFRAEHLTPYYEQVYIDVGEKNRNVDIAQHLGVESIVGTPTVFILESDGTVLNLETAPTWRNAASRSKEEIVEYFRSFRN